MNKRCLVLLLVAVALFMIATTIKSGWLYLVSSALVALVILEAFTSFRATRNLEIEREIPGEVFEGDKLTVRMRIKNTGRAGKYYLSVRDLQFLQPKLGVLREIRSLPGKMTGVLKTGSGGRKWKKSGTGADLTKTIGIKRLGPGERINVKYEMEAARRGVYSTAGVEVSSAGIFEGVSVKSASQFPSDLIVYPKTYPMMSFPFNVTDYASTVKPFESSRKGAGFDYFGIRDYAPGDSLRHIHWKSSARQGKLIVREYQHDYHQSLGIMLLLNKPVYGDLIDNSMEDGLRIAASIIRHLEATGSAPWLAIYREGSINILEHNSPYELMKQLALYEPPEVREDNSEHGLNDSLGLLSAAIPFAGTIAVISNFSPGSLTGDLSRATEMEGNSIILVPDESYGGERALKRVDKDLEILKEMAFRKRVNLYRHESGKDIGECLKEPLSVIAA